MKTKYDTFPKLFLRNVQKYGSKKIAYYEKDLGIWLSSTWEDMHGNVESLALGLLELGIEKGDKVCFIGDNRPEYLWGLIAVQSLGGMTVGIYQDALIDEVEYVINNADVKIAIVEDQEQTDKLLDIKDRIPKLKKVIVDDWTGLKNYKEPLLIKLIDVQRLGLKQKQKLPYLFEEKVAEGDSQDVAIIAYTSGTTGRPKGTMLTYHSLISMGASLEKYISMDDQEKVLTYLPLAWIVEVMISVCWFLRNGFVINFPESAETVQENIREVGPTMMVAPPRVWEMVCSDVQVKMMDASWLKKKIFELCSAIGQKHIDMYLEKGKLGIIQRCIKKICFWLCFRALQDRLGLLNMKHAFTGGSALGPDVFRFYQAFGVNIKQMYGQTEMGGIIATHVDGDVNYETVGNAISEVDIRISETGEILCKGVGMFIGYYKNDEARSEVIDDDGFLRTGDFGYINENGHLVVIDRMKDVIKLSDGSNFSPTFIENRLKFSPYIREGIAIGKDRPFVVALIQIDYAFVGNWAEKKQLSYTTFADLSKRKEVYDLISEAVDQVNINLPGAARISKFLLLEKELDADDAELTRSQKLRRGFVIDKYQELIDKLYKE